MLRCGNLNGNNISLDKDFSLLVSSLLSGGIVSGFAVTTNAVAIGKAILESTRTNGEIVLVAVENTASITIDTTGTKNVWITIDQTKLDDGTANLEDGTGIITVATGASYPASNYIPLASITSGVITDARTMVMPKVASEIQNQSYTYCSTTWSTENNIILTPTPGVTTISSWVKFCFKNTIANTWPCTVTIVWYWTPKNLTKFRNVNLEAGDLWVAQMVEITYSGLTFQLTSPVGQVAVPTVSALVSPFTAGENMSAGQPYRKWLWTLLYVANPTAIYSWAWSIGFSTTNYEIGQSFLLSSTSYIYDIEFVLTFVWSPSLQLNIEIFSNATFTTLVWTSNTIIPVNWNNKFIFWTPPLLSALTYYFKINIVSGSPSTSNYYTTNYSIWNLYPNGQEYLITSANVVTSWSVNEDWYFKVNSLYPSWLTEDVAKKYKANSSNIVANKVQWVVQTTVTVDNSFNGVLGWKQAWYTSLTEWEIVYLKDDGTVWHTAGTTSVKVGRAISTTEINFVPPL